MNYKCSLRVAQGNGIPTTLTLTPQNGLSGTVSLSLQDAPAGVSVSPPSLTVRGSDPVNQTLTIATTGATPVGTHNLSLVGTAGSLSRKVALELVVMKLTWLGTIGATDLLLMGSRQKAVWWWATPETAATRDAPSAGPRAPGCRTWSP